MVPEGEGDKLMKKIIMISIIVVLLVGCSSGINRQLIDEMKNDMIESYNLVEYNEIFQYADKDIIKGYVIKGVTSDGNENLYLLNGVKGIGKGAFDKGLYYSGPISPKDERLDFRVEEGGYYGHLDSFF